MGLEDISPEFELAHKRLVDACTGRSGCVP